LANFKAEGEIVWENICNSKDWEGYQYGLKFIQISKDELLSKADALMYVQKRKKRKQESRLGVRNGEEDFST
jgi:hypothetical protein